MFDWLLKRNKNALMGPADFVVFAVILTGLFYFINDFLIATLFLALLIANVTRLVFRYQAISQPFAIHDNVEEITESPNKLFTHNDHEYPEWIEVDGAEERYYYIGMLTFVNGKANESDVPENCRNIYYGAMYGVLDEEENK